MANYSEDFAEILFDWCAESLQDVPTTEQVQALYDRLSLKDYAKRWLYLLTRDDVFSVMKENGIHPHFIKEDWPESFWDGVRKRIEEGMGGCWSDIVLAATEDVLAGE